MSTLLIKNIPQLVTCDDSDRVLPLDFYCEDGFIKTIGEAWTSPPTDHRRQPYALLPRPGEHPPPPLSGLSRNLPKVQNMELFDWLKTLYEIWKNLDADVIRLSSLTGMGELMKHGCTTCFDHH